MNSFEEIYSELNNDEDEFLPKARYPKKFEPINKYEYCEYFARILDKPIGYVLGRTKDMKEEWLYDLFSYLKTIRDEDSKVKYVMKFFREAQAK